MADLQELFARIKNQSSTESPQAPSSGALPSLWQPAHQLQPSSISSPLISPTIHTPVKSPPSIGSPAADSDRTANLLNLLKFNGQPTQQSGNPGALSNLQNISNTRHSSFHAPSAQPRDGSNARPMSAADLVSNLQPRPHPARTSPWPGPSPSAAKSDTQGSGSQQDFLLNLLTRPTKAQQQPLPPAGEPVTSKGEQTATYDVQARASASVPHLDSPAAVQPQIEAPQPTKAQMFTYVNPFDQLHSSLSENRTPKLEQPVDAALAAPKKVEILKHDRDVSSDNQFSTGMSGSEKGESTNNSSNTASLEKGQQTVSEALENLGQQVDRQVELALAEAMPKESSNDTMPAPTPTATSDEPTIKKETDDDVESNWESAEDTNRENLEVEVYNFPMKPFVSLQIKPAKPARAVRQDNFMVIATLKKEFDQVDRCLVTASQSHIVYAQVATKKDNGGFRIIRQDSGDHKQVFRSSGERVFNIQLCAGAQDQDLESVLGTGVDGTVFMTSLAKSHGEVFVDDDLEAHGFSMPPIQASEENTSGSPVKTRAKLSACHPGFFAVARGKQIYLVSPRTVKESAYCDRSTRKVNSEKYFEEHCLKISTGKAGKDFCFSEDDSVIVSLDKNGRFKFWDIRELTSRVSSMSVESRENIELKEPLWTINAAASGSKSDEKPSVSSIMLLDKDRPFVKGTALRYVLIGFKQNHILQLWDLGLGKAVQELRFPHEKDSDGICSISYHPKTGIIALGHPTRNTIYFIHLSAPKYNLPSMEQAKYVGMLARNETGLPRPESTAIMSGLREFSFAKVGQLRSVEMLRTPVENASDRNSGGETLFELYAMHSKGVVGISIKRDDLGWDSNGKMVNPKDAVAEGVVEVSELTQPPKLSTAGENPSNAEIISKQVSKPVSIKKAELPKPFPTVKAEIKTEREPPLAPAATGLTKAEPASKPLPTAPSSLPLVTPATYASAAQRTKSPAITPALEDPVTAPKAASPAPVSVARSIDGENQSLLKQQFDSLYQRLQADKRVQDAAAGAKQDALLRLVSSTLTENVDRSLTSIISSRIEQDIIPILTEVTGKAINDRIAEALPQQLNASIAAAVKANLINSLQHTLKDKDVHRSISETTATTVSAKVQHQVSTMLQQSLPGMATQATQTMVADLEKRLIQQSEAAEIQHRDDTKKIEELSNLVRSLSSTVQDMASSQAAFQEQILKMQRDRSSTGSAKSSTSNPFPQDSPPEPEDAEVAEMTQKLVNGQYEEATIQWISSDRQAEIFDKLFVRVNPTYLQQVSPLVALTVSAAITSSFDTYVEQRLEWLGRVLSQIDMRDDDIRDVAPKIMDVLSQRLQGAYMEISEARPNDASLKPISALNRQVTEIRRLTQ